MENLGPVGRMGAYLFGPDVLYDVSAAIPDRISFGCERLPSVLTAEPWFLFVRCQDHTHQLWQMKPSPETSNVLRGMGAKFSPVRNNWTWKCLFFLILRLINLFIVHQGLNTHSHVFSTPWAAMSLQQPPRSAIRSSSDILVSFSI